MSQELANTRPHPFAELLNMEISPLGKGECLGSIKYHPALLNPNGVIHGAVLYGLADTSMGGALHSLLEGDEICATIEIKITYFHAAGEADLSCVSRVIKKGRRVAMLESDISSEGRIVARATGSFAVFSL